MALSWAASESKLLKKKPSVNGKGSEKNLASGPQLVPEHTALATSVNVERGPRTCKGPEAAAKHFISTGKEQHDNR